MFIDNTPALAASVLHDQRAEEFRRQLELEREIADKYGFKYGQEAVEAFEQDVSLALTLGK